MNISWTEITRHENPKLLKLANIHKTMNSFCKMIGQLLQTELDPLTTVSYTASACSSELTASVVSWTASALKCTQQTTRCKKSQSNKWTCLQSSSNDMHWSSQTGKDTPELCKSFFWTMQQISTQPTGEPQDPGSILPIKLHGAMQQAAKSPKSNAQALKKEHIPPYEVFGWSHGLWPILGERRQGDVYGRSLDALRIQG